VLKPRDLICDNLSAEISVLLSTAFSVLLLLQEYRFVSRRHAAAIDKNFVVFILVRIKLV
jgi:hypothetical protein